MYSAYLKEIVEKKLIGCIPKSEEEVKFWNILKEKSESKYFTIIYADDSIYDISFKHNAHQEFNLLYRQLLFIENLLIGGTRVTTTKLIANIFEGHAEVKVHNIYGTNSPQYEIGSIDNESLQHLYDTLSFLEKRNSMQNIINNNHNNINNYGNNNFFNTTNNGNVNNYVEEVITKIKEELPPVITKQVDKEIEEFSNTGNPKSLITKLNHFAKEYAIYEPLISSVVAILLNRA